MRWARSRSKPCPLHSRGCWELDGRWEHSKSKATMKHSWEATAAGRIVSKSRLPLGRKGQGHLKNRLEQGSSQSYMICRLSVWFYGHRQWANAQLDRQLGSGMFYKVFTAWDKPSLRSLGEHGGKTQGQAKRGYKKVKLLGVVPQLWDAKDGLLSQGAILRHESLSEACSYKTLPLTGPEGLPGWIEMRSI